MLWHPVDVWRGLRAHTVACTRCGADVVKPAHTRPGWLASRLRLQPFRCRVCGLRFLLPQALGVGEHAGVPEPMLNITPVRTRVSSEDLMALDRHLDDVHARREQARHRAVSDVPQLTNTLPALGQRAVGEAVGNRAGAARGRRRRR